MESWSAVANIAVDMRLCQNIIILVKITNITPDRRKDVARMTKQQYIKEIVKLLKYSDDEVMLKFIYKLLLKESA